MIYSDFKHLLPYSGITVGFGFCPRSYFVTENAGRVTITIEVLKGTPARDVIVTVQTVDSSARGMALKQCNGALKQWWLNKLDCNLLCFVPSKESICITIVKFNIHLCTMWFRHF